MMPNRSKPLTIAVIAASLVCISPATWSQSAGDAVIEEIVVTALKRETKLLETPLSVSAFDGSDLERIGADGLEAYLQFAPGVSFDRTTSVEQRVFIRGLASTYGNTPTGFYIDEVPFTALTVTLSPDVRSFDLERVEVLRGPQGTLYGASSLGGTIRVITKDPTHNEFQAKADVSYGGTNDGDDNYGVKGAVNIPIIDDKLSLRVAGTQEKEGGWIDLENPLTGETVENQNDFDVWTTRAKLRYTPTDSVDVVLGYWHNDSSADNRNLADDSGNSSTLLNATQSYEVVSDLYSGEMDFDLGGATLISSTSYFDYENDLLFPDFPANLQTTEPAFNHTEIKIFTQELRLTSNAEGHLFWTVGAIYIENETFFDFSFALPGFFVNTSTQDSDSESYAFYGEATYSLSNTFDATIGLRYYHDEVTRNDTQFAIPQPEVENTFSDWSPRFNLAWTPSPGTLVFGTISKGFRSGLTQPSVSLIGAELAGIGIEDNIDSETAWNYEVGSKLSLLDQRLTIDAVVYYIDWSDLQTQIQIDTAVIAFINAGDADGYGLEFAVSYRALDSLIFSLSGNVNDTTYADTVTDAFGRVVFEEGAQLQFVPEYTIAGAVDYSHHFRGSWRGVARASIEYVGSREATTNLLTVVEGEKNTRVNFRLGIENNSFGAYLFAENAFDDDSRINPATNAVSVGYASRYRPRTIGLNLTMAI